MTDWSVWEPLSSVVEAPVTRWYYPANKHKRNTRYKISSDESRVTCRLTNTSGVCGVVGYCITLWHIRGEEAIVAYLTVVSIDGVHLKDVMKQIATELVSKHRVQYLVGDEDTRPVLPDVVIMK